MLSSIYNVEKCTLFECQCILHESTHWGHYFYVSNWRRDRHFTWSFERRERLAICRAKAVPSILSHFKTLSVGPVQGIEPATFRSAVMRSTDWASPAAEVVCLLSHVACFTQYTASNNTLYRLSFSCRECSMFIKSRDLLYSIHGFQ